MDLLNQVKSSNGNNSSRTEYSLTEIVGILAMLNEGIKVTDISLMTGRSVHSLRYKFLEKKALKGKDKPRSIHQYASTEELYQSFGVEYSEEDLQRRVNEFKASIEARANS